MSLRYILTRHGDLRSNDFCLLARFVVMEVFRKAWRGWKRLARGIARVQTLILISGFYLVILAPLGALLRAFGWDPLDAGGKRRARTSNWKRVAESDPLIDSLHRQS
jgi:hypothetical protein